MHRTQSTRQTLRRGLILISFLLFPVTINYFSPYLITEAAAGGIINGSAISFALMFLSSLFLGRAWCGWLCPGAGLQEACSAVRDKKVTGRWTDRVKWIIWFPWVGLILFLGISAGGWTRIEPFYMTESIISVVEPMSYIIYYFVVGLMVVLSFTVGNRGMCHSVCWMAPFMIIGRKLRNLPAWPSLRLIVEPEKCSDCKKCVRACPMSLDVNGMVARGHLENAECILCGSCVDTCSQGVIHYSFSGGK